MRAADSPVCAGKSGLHDTAAKTGTLGEGKDEAAAAGRRQLTKVSGPF